MSKIDCGFWGWCLWQNGWYLVDLEKEPRNNYLKSSSCSALWPQLVIMPVKPVVLLLLPSCLLVLVLQIVFYRVAHVICVCARVVGLGDALMFPCRCDPALEQEMLTAGMAEGDWPLWGGWEPVWVLLLYMLLYFCAGGIEQLAFHKLTSCFSVCQDFYHCCADPKYVSDFKTKFANVS